MIIAGSGVNHGTFLHIAHEEGLILNSSIHVGARAPIFGKSDLRNDLRCGFEIVKARDIDRIGVDGVIQRIRERRCALRFTMATEIDWLTGVAGPVYISVDIDVLDPSAAPGRSQFDTSLGRKNR